MNETAGFPPCVFYFQQVNSVLVVTNILVKPHSLNNNLLTFKSTEVRTTAC